MSNQMKAAIAADWHARQAYNRAQALAWAAAPSVRAVRRQAKIGDTFAELCVNKQAVIRW
jgi:hypothetical protein